MNRRWLMVLIAPLVPVLMGASGCGPKSFTVAISSQSVNVAQAGTATVTVSLAGTNGFTTPVTLSATGLPSGVTASFSPSLAPIGSSSTLTLTATTSAAAGKSQITITGQAEGQTISGPLELNVTSNTNPPPAPTAFVEVPAPNPLSPAKTVQLPVKVGADYAIYQGDILFPLSLVQNAGGTGIRPQGNRMQDGYCLAQVIICWDKSYLWPNKTLSYEFGAGVSPQLRAVVQQVAQIYFDRTGIRLVESSAPEDRVRVIGINPDPNNPAAGRSMVGRVNGVQEITFQNDATKRTVLHEFGHALGLWHEHTRADRNSAIRVLGNNIIDALKSDYEIKDDPDVARIDGPYDFASVMHYPARSSASKKDGAGNSLPTFELVNPSSYDINQIGTAQDLSPGDVLALANLYDAPVTDGSIRLIVRGSNKLVNGGQARIDVEVINAGPRDLRDLYFGIQASTDVSMTGTGGLACGATNGNQSGNPILCYVPVGPTSGQTRRYGPITVDVPANAPSGTVAISLGLRPIGTRLADPAKGLSKVSLQQIRVDPDAYEVDNSFDRANPIRAFVPQQRTIHTASDVDYIFIDASDASKTNAYVFSVDAQDTAKPLTVDWFKDDQTPTDDPGYIIQPGKYYVAVRGDVTRYEANLSTINYEKLKDLLLNLPYAPLAFKWDGPSIARKLVRPYDFIGVSGLKSVALRGDNVQIAVYDQNGEIYGRGASVGNGLLSVDVPSTNQAPGKEFFLKVERQNETIIEGNLSIEQPTVEYSIAGCTSVTRLCPRP
jgi:Astacin (Peptidase family M12A)